METKFLESLSFVNFYIKHNFRCASRLCFRYVLLLEADTHSILTLHTKNEDGAYSRRSCSSRPTVIPPNILPHLYGQLVQTCQVRFTKFVCQCIAQKIRFSGIDKSHQVWKPTRAHRNRCTSRLPSGGRQLATEIGNVGN